MFFYTEHGPPWEHPVCHEHVPPAARCGVLQGPLSCQSLRAQLDLQLQSWIYPPLCSIRFCFLCFEALLGDVCTFGADVSSWTIDRFIFTQCPSYPCHRLVRKPTSSDMSVVTPAWFWSVFTWHIFFCQPALYFMLVSCWLHTDWSCFFFHSDHLLHLTDLFTQFTFYISDLITVHSNVCVCVLYTCVV